MTSASGGNFDRAANINTFFTEHSAYRDTSFIYLRNAVFFPRLRRYERTSTSVETIDPRPTKMRPRVNVFSHPQTTRHSRQPSDEAQRTSQRGFTWTRVDWDTPFKRFRGSRQEFVGDRRARHTSHKRAHAHQHAQQRTVGKHMENIQTSDHNDS